MIEQYQHPYVTVDGVVLRYLYGRLEVLLAKRCSEPEQGCWALPGGFCGVEERLEPTLRNKIQQKTGVTGFYTEQLKTYDALERDPRGRILSVAYLCLTNLQDLPGDWFVVEAGGFSYRQHTERLKTLPVGFFDETALGLGYEDLAFDHGYIVKDAIGRLAGKLWYTDIIKNLLPETFTIAEARELFFQILGRDTTNFARRLGERVIKTDSVRTYGENGGRPAAVYRWNPEWRGE